ncbi:phosphatase PAP2 family protein [Candidatus Micrarchaeota archaeon]|nr:phosphatase PAP2 family protein [Candidatus Micrarchaeota archaeon]
MIKSLEFFIADLNIPIFHELSIFLDHPLGLLIVTSLLIFSMTVLFKQKRTVMPIVLMSLLLTSIFTVGAKFVYLDERPCISEKVECTESYSFPSAHSAIGFSLLLPSLGTPAFWFYLIYALILAFSRLYLGVHTILDVAGALGVAIIAYTISKFVILKIEMVAHEIRI